MKSAITALLQYKGRKIAVLGSMKELGAFSEPCHEEVGRFARDVVDELLCFGEETKPLLQAFGGGLFFENQDDLVLHLKQIVKKGDVVLVKGSRSMNMERVIACFFGS